MDFIYFFRILFKRKWVIIGAGLLAAAIAYFFTKKEEKHYSSSTQISTGYTIKEDIQVNGENIGYFEAEAKFNNVILIIKSPSVINLLSYDLILHDLTSPKPFRKPVSEKKKSPVADLTYKTQATKEFSEKLGSMNMLTTFNPEDKRLLDLLSFYNYDFKSLSRNLKIGRLGRTDYLQIEFLSENPDLSAYVVNKLYEQFIRYFISLRDTRSLESIDTLRSIMDKKKLAADYKRAAITGEGIINVELENSSSLDRITNVEKTLTDEKTKLNKLYSDLKKINQRLASINSPRSNNTEYINANNELLALKKARDEAYDQYTASGATNKALLNKYNQLKIEYQNKLTELTRSNEQTDPVDKYKLQQDKTDLEIDIQATETNIRSLQGRINELKGTVVQDASKAANAESLTKEVELANNEYLEAKQKYNEALDKSSSFVNNFRQVLPGQPALEPEPSKSMLIIGMAGIAAIFTSMLIIILLTYLDSSIKTPGVFSKIVGLKLISMVNFMNFNKRSIQDIVKNSGSHDDPTDRQRVNVFRESLRKLRYEIENSGRKIFLFTSTKKGQGKTTLIQALSFSMSLRKKKILIIDTNFCNNDLTVQLHAEPILEKININQIDTQSVLKRVKQASKDVGEGTGTVFAIGSEGGDYTPAEILPNENILRHLNELTEEYDYIFLEGPPLNDFSDSKELVQYVEGVIAIFSATHIMKQIDRESIKFFKEMDGKFCGAVLNMVEMENLNVS